MGCTVRVVRDFVHSVLFYFALFFHPAQVSWSEVFSFTFFCPAQVSLSNVFGYNFCFILHLAKLSQCNDFYFFLNFLFLLNISIYFAYPAKLS